MQQDERLKLIQDMLTKNGAVKVVDLCCIFKVSEISIRRDLDILVKQHIAVRNHGGATLYTDNLITERPYNLRMLDHQAEKNLIALEALPLITEGSKVFFDCSTSVYAIAKHLNNNINFLAVTDTLYTALELSSRTNVKTMCLGGEVNPKTNSSIGNFAENMMQNMYFDIAFIGLPSVSVEGTMTVTSITECTLKRILMNHSKTKVLVVDHSKLRDPDFLILGNISEIDILLTDSKMDQKFINFCQHLKIKTILAQV
jgi:DeoR/GlpR family transcriptional regulator of sugar metabolism